MASNGVRGEVPLTLEQRAQVQSYLSKFDMDGVTVRWVDDRNLNTAYGDMFGGRILNIGSDVVPGNFGAGTLTANSRVPTSSKFWVKGGSDLLALLNKRGAEGG